MQKFISKSKEETQKIASDFAKSLRGGEVLCFYGNLGSGKSTFIQALAKVLGVKENVTSPTFVLLKRYKIKPNNLIKFKNGVVKNTQYPIIPNIQYFYHLDCYRLNNPQEALDLGIEEIWNDSKNIIAIEWADKITDILPEKRIDLRFESLGENERKIMIFKG